MSKIEEYKREKDGLDLMQDLPRFAREGWASISEGDRERLKWLGIFYRRRTPGDFMMRVRIPNGISRSAQFLALAQICKEFGKGFADLTTRQQIQLRCFKIEHAPLIMERLKAVGLSTLQTGMDNIRNVVGCPIAGLAANELLDASPIARQFTEIFLGNRDYTNLPRKVNVTITGCRDNCTHPETQDIALIPAIRQTSEGKVAGFNVLAGGKLGSGGYRIATPLDAFVEPGSAAALAAALVLIFRDHGPRESRSKARLAFLLEQWGPAKLRLVLEERLGRELERAGNDVRERHERDHVGIFAQKQPGLNYAGLAVPVGRITAKQVIELARLAEAYGNGEIRLTTAQNVILPNVPDGRIGELAEESLLKELRYEPPEIIRGLVSCTGIDYCNLALIETKNRALKIAQALAPKLPANKPLTVRWSGCPAGCGNHSVADVGLVGKRVKTDSGIVDAVDIYVGGSAGPRPSLAAKLMEDVPCEGLEGVLEGLLRFGAFESVREQLRAAAPASAPLAGESLPALASSSPVTRREGSPTLADFPEGKGALVKVDGLDLAVFRRFGRLFALQNTCPHEGAALAEGELEGDFVICPGHGFRFNVRTGACSNAPDLRARTYPVILRDGVLKLDQE
ncbi:MAG TPA: Rieske 2Fe-2S domain-containing protein [Terriglobia bacterium]|nr:Rieske 2Fe-2S domain-containing protein [Terriglobia bacterium]